MGLGKDKRSYYLLEAFAGVTEGGNLMMGKELKPRETGTLSPDKLLRILRGIYPEEVAQELFREINEHVDDSEDAQHG